MYRIPVPYLKLTEDFQIVNVSKPVTHLFHPVSSFLDLVDIDSRSKIKRILSIPSPGKMELNLKTTDSPTSLFTVYFNYQKKEKLIHLVCLDETSSYTNVQMEYQQWRQQIQTRDWNDVVPNPTELEPELTEFNRKQAERKINTINDLLGIIKEDLSEAGKLEYIKLIQSELEDIKGILRA
ncbi:hypothetical protein [Sutcliffiella horikoshii]|uniref:hypothetical protein n=1 Tax=Sutcliffiella horikoshii TaxID=79883 RepID=UPI001F2B1176|nr:hypothetical protein [Sutcliffiella horikoshii]MCG1020186.1 hypothetical protein [Sutcliffiella horikoshii]